MELQEALARIEELEKQLEIQTLLADSAFEALGVFDEEMRCVAANSEVSEVLGYSQTEALGMVILDVVSPEYHQIAKANVSKGVREPYFVMGVRKDGSKFPAEVRGRTVFCYGKPCRVAAIRDITFRMNAHADLQASLHEMEIIFANTKIGLMFLQGGRIVKRVNQALADIFGYESPDEMVNLDIRKLHLSEERYEDFGERFFSALAKGSQLNIEYRLRCKDGSPVWCSLSGKAVDTDDPVDLNKGVLWVVDNISARKAEEMHLRRLATTDDLTGALTRKEFFRQVKNTMERVSRNPVGYSLLMVDLDHFKRVNDQYGHEAGDTVLQSFVFECRKVLREGDLLARIGGEEFALFLPETDLGGAIRVAERLRKRIAASMIPTRDGALSYTVSIGVSWNNSRDVSIAELLRRADQSLYEAKDEGRNRVAFYD